MLWQGKGAAWIEGGMESALWVVRPLGLGHLPALRSGSATPMPGDPCAGAVVASGALHLYSLQKRAGLQSFLRAERLGLLPRGLPPPVLAALCLLRSSHPGRKCLGVGLHRPPKQKPGPLAASNVSLCVPVPESADGNEPDLAPGALLLRALWGGVWLGR